jgi:hypothetical protein
MTEPADTEGTPITLAARVARLEETVVVMLGLVANLRRDIGQASAPVAFAAPDGTVAIRDPNIIAQEQATGMRGNAPHVPPPE